MNRAEWITDGCHLNEYWRYVNNALKQWKAENNITERCAVHHRDDTEETQKYNEEHYELWGCNEDGTFEYGKYIVFMTQAEHARYHNKGKKFSEGHRAKLSAAKAGSNSPWYGKNLSEATRTKLSIAHLGKKHSEETLSKMSAARNGISTLYATYKNNGGILKWREFQKALKNGEITFEMQPITVYTK